MRADEQVERMKRIEKLYTQYKAKDEVTKKAREKATKNVSEYREQVSERNQNMYREQFEVTV